MSEPTSKSTSASYRSRYRTILSRIRASLPGIGHRLVHRIGSASDWPGAGRLRAHPVYGEDFRCLEFRRALRVIVLESGDGEEELRKA